MADLNHDPTLRARLYSGLRPHPCGCLLWTRSCNKAGYGRIGIRGADGKFKIGYVHIAAWELENGPVPEGLELDHVKARGCRYRNCANLDHLEPVTHQMNKSRSLKTHCSRDHEYTPENTYIDKKGNRHCRACNLDRQLRWREDHPGYYKPYDQARRARSRPVTPLPEMRR